MLYRKSIINRLKSSFFYSQGIISLLVFAICFNYTFSQNIVPNPDFENYNTLPTQATQWSYCDDWNNVNMQLGAPGGTPDYFHSLGQTSAQLPNTYMAYNPSFSGDAYIGIVTYAYFSSDFREYLATKLTTPMIVGEKYAISLWVSNGLSQRYSNYSIDRFGINLSTNPLFQANTEPINVIPQFEFPGQLWAPNWTQINFIFTADQAYEYITIGNFRNDALTATQLQDSATPESIYYFIDKVEVVPIETDLYVSGLDSICKGDTAILQAHNDTSYKWVDSLNPSVILSTDSFINVSPSVTTTYLIYGTNDTVSYKLTINPIPSIDLGSDTTLCFGEILTLDATINTGSYLWQNNSFLPTYTVNQAGTYFVQVTTINNCFAVDSIVINYQNLPLLDLGNDTILCPFDTLNLNLTNLNTTFLWQDNSTNSTMTIYQSGIYWVELTSNNCSDTDTINVLYKTPNFATLLNDTSLCIGEILNLDASSPNSTYLWQDNSTQSTFNVNTAGTYWVEITSNDCVSRDTTTVNYNPIPNVFIGNDTTLCEGETLTLNASTPDAYFLWNDGSTQATQTIFEEGLYSVLVTSLNCTNFDEIIVDYESLPIVNLGKDTTICKGEIISLEAYNIGASYLWQNSSNNSSILVSNEGEFYVEVSNYCAIVYDTIRVNTKDCNCGVYIPNSFTPNGDLINDVFIPRSDCPFIKYKLLIFDRWGNIIFSSDNENNSWDGKTIDGTLCPNDSYIYLLKYKFKEPNIEEKRGSVILLK